MSMVVQKLKPFEDSLIASGIRILSRVPYERQNSNGKIMPWWKYRLLSGQKELEFAISERALVRVRPQHWLQQIVRSCVAKGRAE